MLGRFSTTHTATTTEMVDRFTWIGTFRNRRTCLSVERTMGRSLALHSNPSSRMGILMGTNEDTWVDVLRGWADVECVDNLTVPVAAIRGALFQLDAARSKLSSVESREEATVAALRTAVGERGLYSLGFYAGESEADALECGSGESVAEVRARNATNFTNAVAGMKAALAAYDAPKGESDVHE